MLAVCDWFTRSIYLIFFSECIWNLHNLFTRRKNNKSNKGLRLIIIIDSHIWWTLSRTETFLNDPGHLLYHFPSQGFFFFFFSHRYVRPQPPVYLLFSMPLLPLQCMIMKFNSLSSQLPAIDFFFFLKPPPLIYMVRCNGRKKIK